MCTRAFFLSVCWNGLRMTICRPLSLALLLLLPPPLTNKVIQSTPTILYNLYIRKPAICFSFIFFDSTHSCCCFLKFIFPCSSFVAVHKLRGGISSAGHLMWIAMKCHFDLRHASIIIWWIYTRSGFFTYRKSKRLLCNFIFCLKLKKK